MQVLVGFRRSGAPLRRNPTPAGKKSNLSVYPFDRRREGVDTWTFLLGCVRLGHRKTQNQDPPQPLQRFPPFRPKWEFRAISPGTRYGESDAGEAGHSPEGDIGHVQHPTHLYTYGMEPPSFRWGSDAPEPLSGETLDPLEKSQTCRLPL